MTLKKCRSIRSTSVSRTEKCQDFFVTSRENRPPPDMPSAAALIAAAGSAVATSLSAALGDVAFVVMVLTR